MSLKRTSNMLEIQTLRVGQLGTNCYIVSDSISQKALILDPGDEAHYISEKITSLHLTPIAIYATHGHFDHILAALELQLIFRIPLYVHPDDRFLLARMKETAGHFLQRKIEEEIPIIIPSERKKSVIHLGKEKIRIIPTPGHTPGSVSFYSEKYTCIFSGDTIFKGGEIGDWHHVYSDKQVLLSSVKKILSLPKDTIVYPGHGEQTRVGHIHL